MIKSRTLLAGVASMAAVLAVVSVWPKQADQREGLVALPELRWPSGQSAMYSISYTSTDRVVPVLGSADAITTGASIETGVRIDAQLTIVDRGSATDGVGQLVEVSLDECDDAEFTVQGQVVWASGEDCSRAMRGTSIFAEISPRGTIVRILDNPSQDATSVAILQYIAMSLQMKLSAEPLTLENSWTRSEETLLGTAKSEYLLDKASDGFSITRKLLDVSSLRVAQGLQIAPIVKAGGKTRIGIREDGLLSGLSGDLNVVGLVGELELMASRSQIELSLQSVTPTVRDFDANRRTRLVARNAHEARTGSVADAQILSSRIDGLTRKEMITSFAMYGNDGQFPDHNRFLWRVTGLLQKHPEYCKELLTLYSRDEASHPMQTLLLDVLASTGHAQAQSAMVKALALNPQLDGFEARRRYQRLGLLESPSSATGDSVAADYQRFRRQSGSTDQALVTAYSLGAIAGNLGPEHLELAEQFRTWLAEDLERARDNQVVAHYVSALGNARGDEMPEVLAPFAEHHHSKVRRSVATALGHVENNESRQLLARLLADSDPIVQRAAIQSASGVIDSGLLLELAEVAGSRGIDKINVRTILGSLSRSKRNHPTETALVLEAMLDAGIDDSELRQAANQLLRS